MSFLLPLRGALTDSAVVTLTLLGLVGHVCVVPSAAEALAANAGETHHQGQDDGSDSSHVASCCDATVSRAVASVSDAPALLQLASGATHFEALPVAPRDRRVNASRMPRSDPGPPLFVLHASLLI